MTGSRSASGRRPKTSGLRSIGLVARREVLERGRSGYYIGSTLLTLFIVVAVIAAPAFFDRTGAFTVGVVGDVPTSVVQQLRAAPGADIDTVVLADETAMEAALVDGTVDAALTRDQRRAYTLVWQSDEDPLLASAVSSAIATVQLGERAADLGIAPSDVQSLLAPPDLTERTVEVADPERAGRWWLTFMMLLLLFMTIATYGTFVLTGVVEEKSSRVVEVLLSRVAPRHLLAGKVVGIGLLALGQLVLLVAASVTTLRLVPEMPGPIPELPVGALPWLLVWYLLGYAFYSMGYGAVGALASRMEDAQTASGPLTFTLVAVYFFVFWFVADNLDSAISTIASFVPITAPLVMPLRLAFGHASGWEAVAAVAVMLASVYGLVRLAGRVYTGAILRTGRRIGLREAWSART